MISNRKIFDLVQFSNKLLSEGSISEFEKTFFNNLNRSSFICDNKFPIIDSYLDFEDEKHEKIKKLSLFVYLAGYSKDDISIELNEKTNELIISGKHPLSSFFPNDPKTIRLTNNATFKNFKVKYNIQNYDVHDIKMENGVLRVELTPNEYKTLKKLDIN